MSQDTQKQLKEFFNKHSSDIKISAILAGAVAIDIGLAASGMPTNQIAVGMTLTGLTATYFVADEMDKAAKKTKTEAVKVKTEKPKI